MVRLMTSAVQPSNMFIAASAVGIGAALGALLRWQLGVWLNPLHGGVPPGTLVANVVGGYLVGVAVAWFAQHPDISPAWRLFAITGFLGGLTTFSTFSAEVMSLVEEGRFTTAGVEIALHLFGSMLATLAGMASIRAVQA